MSYEKTVSNYFEALDANDLDHMLRLFAADAVVHSPFLGELPASEFFPKVFGSSSATRITVFDILVSAQGQPRAVGYFNYDWTMTDGTAIQFDAADVFDFASDGRIAKMTILYDTYPVRGTVGNKYT
ncbi:MAG: nuclear transport factor 2 family protein [Woeseiaceae bacterium]|jgi:ketosteroid isomerase-like protein